MREGKRRGRYVVYERGLLRPCAAALEGGDPEAAAPAAPAPHPVATQRERKTPAAAVSRFFRFIGIPPFGSGLLEKV